MNKIKVSVIVPVFNTEKYLQECLDSLQNQSLKDIEIICIDDGSDDNSLVILKNYEKTDARFKIFSQQNKGQSAARNKGLEAATGEYVGFIDSDDFAKEDMFEKLYCNAKNFNSDISMCSINVYDEKTSIFDKNDPYMTLDLFPKEMENKAFSYHDVKDFVFRICVAPWNKIYKKSFLNDKNISFPLGLNFEDNVFFYETFFQAKTISLVNQHLIVYRKASATSYTFGNQDWRKLDFFDIFEKIETFLIEKSLIEEFRDYFSKYKKNTLTYWYKKLHDNSVKQQYEEKYYNLYQEKLNLLTSKKPQ